MNTQMQNGKQPANDQQLVSELMKPRWECYNAFKEKGRIYVFGDRITDAEYQKISDRNKKWFFEITN